MATYQQQLERLRYQREAREKAEAERKANQLTPEQIKHWRLVLCRIVGPGAMLIPDATVQEFRDRGGAKVIDAIVPLAEMFGYVTQLRSMTQGRAASSMEFAHYAEVPKNVEQEIVGERGTK